MTTQKSDSIEDDYADEEDFPAQLEPVRETNESLKEKIKKEQVQHTSNTNINNNIKFIYFWNFSRRK